MSCGRSSFAALASIAQKSRVSSRSGRRSPRSGRRGRPEVAVAVFGEDEHWNQRFLLNGN